MWLTFLLLGIVSLSAQQYSLKGEVLDELGDPLIGATVKTKSNPNNGVMTDINGRFALNVSKGDVLQVSYIGYVPVDLPITGQNDIKIEMKEDAQTLDEVVVVGYGTMRKKDLTGAVTQINPDKVGDQNPATVQDLLRGTPGLQIGYSADAKGGGSIQLRGQNSLYTDGGHNSPLIVLDGMIFYGELSEINPEDISQIDVLKDASSTAVYGARAAAGVIIVTTKKGKIGKPVVTISANLGVKTKSDFHEMFSREEYLQHRHDYFVASTYGFNPESGAYEAYQAVDGKGNPIAPKGYYEHYNNLSSYGISQEQWMGYSVNPEGASMDEIYFRRLFDMSQASTDLLNNYLNGSVVDWNDLTFRNGFNQDYNASISGASDRMNYYLSFGYMRNEGAIRGNEYTTFRSNMKISGKVTDWLEIGANVNFQDRSDGDIPVSLGGGLYDNMLWNSYYATYRMPDGSFAQYPMGNKEKRGYNYDNYKQYYELEKGYTILNSIITAKVTLPFGFSYHFNIAPRYQFFYDRWFMSADLPDSKPSDRGVNRGWGKRFDWSLNNTIIWDRTFKDKHHFIVTLVQEAEENRNWSDNILARNIKPTDALGFHNTQNATISDSKFNTSDFHYTADAWMGRLFYSFDNRYMITTTVRRDGYCAFGQNYPHATFPSVALGWTFTNEPFWQLNWWNNGKLRLSWGKNGNRSLGDPYVSLANLGSGQGATMTYLDKNGNPVTEMKYLMMDRLANPNLQWEKTTAWNVGLDLGFFDYRLNATIDFYHKKTTDMIMSMRLPGFSGFSNITTNLGQVDNTGIELAVTSTNIRMRDFEWQTSVGFSYNKNRIRHIKYEMEDILDENGNVIGQREMNDTGNNWFIDKPIGEMWDYEMIGIWQVNEAEEAARYGQRPGDPKVANHYTEDDIVNPDGSITPVYNEKDKVFLGCVNPPIYWNMRNEFKFWNNLTFAFSLYSYMGHKSWERTYLNRDNDQNKFTYGYNHHKKEYWTPENPTNKYARIQAVGPSGVENPIKIHNRNFVRLDNISLGYSLPEKWVRKAMIEKVRLTASINNVCTIASDWEFGDPETGGFASRTYNFGVQLTF